MEFNPVIVKELRGRMRGWRTTAVITVHLVVVGGLMLLVYGSIYTANPYSYNATYGKQLLFVIVGMQLVLLSLISPISTAGSISGEREKQTYDVLLTTQLSPLSIIIGKLGAALAFAVLLIVITIPLQVLALLMGGLSLDEVVLANVVLLAMTLLYGTIGIACSCQFRTTLIANSAALGVVVSFALILPIFGGLLLSSISNQNPGLSQTEWFQWLAVTAASLNPALAMFLSDQLLSSSDSLIITNLPNIGYKVDVLHPWLVFTLFAIALSGLLIWRSTRVLRPRAGWVERRQQREIERQTNSTVEAGG